MRSERRWASVVGGLLLWGCDVNNPCYKLHPTAECTRLDLSAPVQDLSMTPDLAQVCKPVTDTAKAGEVLVPCGTYLQGSKMNDPTDPGVDSSEMPATMQVVQAFYMDQTEVTVQAYQGCVEASTGDGGTACTAPAKADSYCNYGIAAKNQHPINCVTWDQAWAYCRWRSLTAPGTRLPTETEWEYAARGAAHSTYPWGNTSPVVPADMGQPSQACWDQPNGTCPVAQFPSTLLGQPSPAGGLYDLAGNVWEWTDTQYGPYPPNHVLDSTDGGPNTERVLRGGSWYGDFPDFLRAASRSNDTAGDAGVRIGFRCSRTPQ